MAHGPVPRVSAVSQELALLGVRHHGPGSARAVRAALEQFKPDVVLVEGPPEADAVVGLAADEGMRPPVALLAHVVDDSASSSFGGKEPGRAAFWPVAEFSPEWVAITHALDRGVPVRFIDLPAAHSFALRDTQERERDGRDEDDGHEWCGGDLSDRSDGSAKERGAVERDGDDAGAHRRGDDRHAAEENGGDRLGEDLAEDTGGEETSGEEDHEDGRGNGDGGRDAAHEVRIDPLGVLAEAAGYDDAERWWEDAVELRAAEEGGDALAPFTALAEAMGALRERYGHGGDSRDLLREAHMRLGIRRARREFERVAVVCGAWHVPALAQKATVTADRQLLKGLPKCKVDVTWVPWTHRRLGHQSGYGAGITSPGWYHHLFTSPDRPIARWMTKVANLLREEDHPVSSAHVIEAVRLAETLAVMRGRPLAGLTESVDAVRAVMCDGSDVPLRLIHDRLVVGGEIGDVPDSAPAVPLQRDLARTQRSLRLRPEAVEKEYELDLRKDMDAARSRLLHRLRLLGIEWGEPVRGRGNTGTFRETWLLRWEPELAVRTAEAGVWGTTVSSAATAKAEDTAMGAPGLADVTALAERCLLADLPDALPTVMRVLADRAALDADVGHLAQALPALVRSVRYGDVRGTDSAALREVAEGLAVRVCVGLPPACPSLDADGAREMRGHVESAHQAIGLLGSEDTRKLWTGALRRLATGEGGAASTAVVPGLLRGRAARLLLDDGAMDAEEVAGSMGRALSPGTGPAEAAAWIEGFLAGGGMLLVHDERLLGLVDDWLSRVSPDVFNDVLPLLRRTFSEFESGVRRTVGELVRRGSAGSTAGLTGHRSGGGTAPLGFGPVHDTGRADAVLPTVRLLLGLEPGSARSADSVPATVRSVASASAAPAELSAPGPAAPAARTPDGHDQNPRRAGGGERPGHTAGPVQGDDQ